MGDVTSVDGFAPRDLASLVWSFASMSIDHPRLRKTLGEGVRRSVRQLSAIDLASIAWSLAILQWHDGILDQIADATQLLPKRDLPVQALSNLAWCFATLQWKTASATSLLETIALHGERSIGEFRAQDLANTTWALAALTHRFAQQKAFMDAAANAAKDLIEKSQKHPTNPHSFTPQGISNIIWALATVAVSSQKPLLDAFSASLELQNLKTWKAQELSNTAWAFATLLVMDAMVLDTISEMALQQLEHFGFRHSANLVWALATLEKTQEPLMQAIAQTAAANAYELSPLSLASTAWACVSMSVMCFPLLDVMAKILFRSPVDDGIATMAIWTLSRLPDLDLAFQLVHSAQWRIPPLSLSALLEACEQRGISQLRVLRLLAHGHLKPVVLDLLDTMEANSSDRTVKSSDGSLEP